MKKIRQIALPLAILLVGAGSAYATSVTKSSTKDAAEKLGYRWNPEAQGVKCVQSEELCTTENTGNICTVVEGSDTHQLFDGDGIPCEQVMYRIQ